jgi:hypothetical protein
MAALWSAFVVVVCAYANGLSGALLGGVVLALAVLWFAVVRRRFVGPKVTLAGFEGAVDVQDLSGTPPETVRDR